MTTPNLWIPGMCDPRLRSFTRAIGSDGGHPADVMPPPEDLDRVALLATSGKYPDDVFQKNGYGVAQGLASRDGSGSFASLDVMLADGALGNTPQSQAFAQSLVLARWRQMLALGPLPEDQQMVTSDPEFRDWPDPGDNDTRIVFCWSFQFQWQGLADPISKLMQVQKFSKKANDGKGEWKILNKWGQDLTYEWKPGEKVWEAGWNIADWTEQHAIEILDGIQIAFSALLTIASFGMGSIVVAGEQVSVASAEAAMQAAQQGAIEAMKKIQAGDGEGAALAFAKAGGALAGNAIIAQGLGDAVKNAGALADSPPVRALAKVLSSSKGLDLGSLVDSAMKIGTKIETITAQTVAQAKALLSRTGGVYFDWARDAVKRGTAIADSVNVPWYAVDAWNAGAQIGALEQAQLYASALVYEDGTATQSFRQVLARQLQSAAPAQGALSFRQVLAQSKGSGPIVTMAPPTSTQAKVSGALFGLGIAAAVAAMIRALL